MTSDWHDATRRGHGDSYRPGYSKLPRNIPVSPNQLQAAIKGYKPEGTCRDCDRSVKRRSPMGPMPERCPGCAADRKATRDRKRKRGLLPDNKPRRPRLAKPHVPPCCQDAGRVCSQHRQAKRFEYDYARHARSKEMVSQFFATFGDGFSVHGDDYEKP